MRSLASRCRKSVDAQLRHRGSTYASEGRVRLLRHEPTEPFVTAVVRGSTYGKTYQVRIDWRRVARDNLNVECDCPYAASSFECKHIWAVLLELDRLGMATRVPGNQDLWLVNPRLVPPKAPPLLPPWRQRLDTLLRSGAQKPVLEGGAEPVVREIWLALDPKVPAGGTLRIEFLQRQQTMTGGWGKLKALSLAPDEPVSGPPALVSACAVLLDLLPPPEPWRYNPRVSASAILLASNLAPLVVPQLCATGRFGWREENLVRPLAWDDGPPWQLKLVGQEDAEGQLHLGARFCRPGEAIEITSTRLALRTGLLFLEDRVARLEIGDHFLWALDQVAEGDLTVPSAQVPAVLSELWSGPRVPPIELPERLAPRIEERAPNPRVRLSAQFSTVLGTLSFDYGGEAVRAADARSLLPSGEPRTLIRRDPEAERTAREQLESEGWIVDGQGELVLASGHLADAIAAIEGRGWQVELDGKRVRLGGTAALRVESGIDWFDLEGDFDFGGSSVGLPVLLKALRQRANALLLQDGSLGLIPAEWIARFHQLADLTTEAQASGDAVRFGAHQGLVLDALLAAEPGVAVDEVFGRVRERLRTFDRLVPQPAPEGFQGELRPYQEGGLAWLQLLSDLGLGGCLADDMGLGKTVQLLAHLAARRQSPEHSGQPTLLVVPKSVIPHWSAEAERFTPELKLGVFHGTGRHTMKAELGQYDVLVTTYATLRQDLTQLRDQEFDTVVLDEAQAIKNGSSLTAKACRLVRARHRLALTGTPVENHLGELWSLFEFLNPGLLGHLPALAEHAGRNALPPAALATVARALRPLMLRRTKEQVLPELPPKTEQTLTCELTPKERKRYDQLRDHYRRALLSTISHRGIARSKIMVLEALLRLRQAACHPGLIDPAKATESSAKLDLLLDQLQEVVDGGHKALVFSQFTKLLAIVRNRLDRKKVRYAYLDGRTTDRQAKVNEFQQDEGCQLFLISLKAGGVGLNLTAASYVFLLDPWWNPAVEAQAIDRSHRIGQTRAVFAYRLIASDTVEEKILDLQAEKRALADAIVAQDDRLLKQLTVEDLERLLG